ncbi:hypothetical protein RJ641_010471 [Dillenia turbinata]|uniref:Uncharacterized protein n=1 Tax=Dillenia turbinata TaxID=194707 RepID=A0AAN8Z4B4_9MAGN
MSKLLEDFRPIFGDLSALGQFLFLVHSPQSFSLTFHVTDFYSTWEAVKSISQLEDLRSDSGIGGSLYEFVDYIVASLKSGDVKLDLEDSQN